MQPAPAASVSVGRLISTDALESTISELVAVVRTQSAEIASLKATVSRLEASTAAPGSHERIFSTLQSLDSRVEQCSRAITLPARVYGDGASDLSGSATVSSAVCNHDRRLADLERRAACDDSATGHDDSLVSARLLRHRFGELEAKLSAAVAKLSETTASRASMAAVQRSLEGQLSQVSALQALLGTKMDRSELSRLEAIAADLGGFDGWKGAVDSDISELYGKAEEARRSADAAFDSLSRLSSVAQGIADSVRGKAEE
jgi:hypothetical protein